MFNGRRQPSCGGTSRMMREYQVRICERLGVKFPGSTRPIQLARRIERSDGSFAGVIVASLDPNYLSRFYSSVDIGEAGYVRIVGTDGIVRAVGGHTPELLGQDLSGVTLFSTLRAIRRAGFTPKAF